MKNNYYLSGQRGATLVVGLIMLAVITLLTVSAFTLSGGNLKAVGNMQFRNEAIAAANMAIEQTINVNFSAIDHASYPATVNVDIDQNNTTDYVVNVKAPICIKATLASIDPSALSGINSNVTSPSDLLTLWEIEVEATNLATGASVVARQGINKRLTLNEYLTSTC
ncbi:MAG: pilus assembly PilX N-terminal domain-containing protein [Nitrosomonas sp.]|nr:pilus assembly PilX N-terminal domain-containing protein [Nitrosomonas sp.]MDP1950410.1 pilus assembly PilX N-terminal domain-containing protein [Nitrosomonas sp.]